MPTIGGSATNSGRRGPAAACKVMTQKQSGIYAITCQVDGRVYIGSKALTGRVFSPAWRAKIKAAKTGKPWSPAVRAKHGASFPFVEEPSAPLAETRHEKLTLMTESALSSGNGPESVH